MSDLQNTNGPPDLMLDPRAVCLSMDELVSTRPTSTAAAVAATGHQEATVQGHGKKAEASLTEAQRFSSLPRRPAVNIHFKELSFSVREGPWWSRKGRLSSGSHWAGKTCHQTTTEEEHQAPSRVE